MFDPNQQSGQGRPNGFSKSSPPPNQGAGQPNPQTDQFSPPTLSLPKGGGAIRGIGEKFAANPVTGTGSMSVPIATSPGRSGFGPQLSLAYDSGSGNGPFGFGWSLSLPSITRKTEKGLPKYDDANDSDVFILSGAEDLVPVFVEDCGKWQRQRSLRTVEGDEYRIECFRPRIEGLFARIERWTNPKTRDAFWRSISKDNITTWYGRTSESRVSDPENPTHIFSWLICESYDDKGNAILYHYKEENSDGVDLAPVHEKNRTPLSRSSTRYLKRIQYGNTVSRLVQPDLSKTDWLFEVVFDYGEHHLDNPLPDDSEPWLCRHDPFSSYRPGFELRTYRLCQRVLMFHHFPKEEEVGKNCLVRSTDFAYRNIRNCQDDCRKGHPVGSFIGEVTQNGYKRKSQGGYIRKWLPPLEFEYSRVEINETIQEIDPESLENLPYGLDGTNYQWVDLNGEGISGILTEQGNAWFYKPNVGDGRFGPIKSVATKPSLAALGGSRQQLLDLAGDGQLDLVQFEGPSPGFFERTADDQWKTFKTFPHLPNISWSGSNLRFVDLDGDGHADVLITEDEVLTWHPSLSEEGFGQAERVYKSQDEEKGPKLVFADGTQSVYLADMSGDGMTDLVRIRNGEVCYWPNQGYGKFGSRVTMDQSPWFDHPDLLDQRRIRIADIDGSGNTDIIYLHADGVRLYFNCSGNSWSDPHHLGHFPSLNNLTSITTVDLLGNGTACLVWSSPLPTNTQKPLRYIDLMGGQKPHLLIKTANNLGAETHVHYAPSTKFYLADKASGNPWITRLPFLVHVVERVETYDRISRNRFVTRYAYHHGYFDAVEREFRGFGLVEQWDTEEFAALRADGEFPIGDNFNAASHVPPVRTKTWFHTGVYLDPHCITKQYEQEYYKEGDSSLGETELTEEQRQAMLLPDTVLPTTRLTLDGARNPWALTPDEARQAARSLKGAILRQEIYAQDGTEKEDRPYTVSERNYTIELFQPALDKSSLSEQHHAVFFVHSRETIDFQYERTLYDICNEKRADPRVTHQMTLEVDVYGNVLQSVAIGYGRRYEDPYPLLTYEDREKQKRLHITHTENHYTNLIEKDDDYRTPLPCETQTWEIGNLFPKAQIPNVTNLFRLDEMDEQLLTLNQGNYDIPYEQWNVKDWKESTHSRRLIANARTLYRRNDLEGPLGFGGAESLALPLENYQLAFTPGLIQTVYGNRVTDAMLGVEGRYVHSEKDLNWWIPSGRMFYSPETSDTASEELMYARQHFFFSHRYRGPFHTEQFNTESIVTFDDYDLLVQESQDALGNRVTVGERDSSGTLISKGQDYRILQPKLLMDPNRNRSSVAFDVLGMVVGTAVMGKLEENLGDALSGFEEDLSKAVILDHLANPLSDPHAILNRATTRLVYDLFAYQRSRVQANPQPSVVYSLARETHDADLTPGQQAKIRHSFSYSDGFGREIQKKIQAESGTVPLRNAEGKIQRSTDSQMEMTQTDVRPRWVGNGWRVLNNKGKTVRQYEPFFTDIHHYEFDVRIGVSTVFFYDSVERAVAALHPNHTWEKVVFDAWRQESWDVNDTVQVADPENDSDAGEFFRRMPHAEYLPTWHTLRTDPTHVKEANQHWPIPETRDAEKHAADKASVHAATPTVAYSDSLGRTFRTILHNKYQYTNINTGNQPVEEFHGTQIILDVEGNQREVIDAKERVVMRYGYDMLGNRIHQASMEAGQRWILNDVAGKPIRVLDSRDHQFRTAYDQLRRPIETYMSARAEALLVEQTVYGETWQNPEANSLRGKVVQIFDQAGVVTTDDYDFKGNLLSGRRQLAQEYKAVLDWSVDVTLEAPSYTSRSRYDALNRPIQLTAPHSDLPGTKINVIQPSYNEANLLEQVNVWLNQNTEPTDILDLTTANLSAVTNINYDAKGQRSRINYGNGVRTNYEYDPLTFRLIHLKTTRIADVLQNLHYTYDPVGNITHIRDDAQQTLYFRNRRVAPNNDYAYDALYKLIEATGREHLGQIDGTHNAATPDSSNRFHRGHNHPADGRAMGRYLEQYVYDAVGNILSMQHRGSDPLHPGWRRDYAHSETSQLEMDKVNNRLSTTTMGFTTETYDYDGSPGIHGNITTMPHLPLMLLDYRDQLHATARQVVSDGGTPETTWYVYDASGQRVRKVTERQTTVEQTPTRMKERIYLGSFEIYREYSSEGKSKTVERETLQVMDDQQRIALVETRTQGNDGSPVKLIRYQLSNHLGSVSLELDSQAQIISYEECYPYGSTSHKAVRRQTQTPKRYRYTGKERDEENGLYYYGARYYAPWLGRWINSEPSGLTDGLNLYVFVQNNPIVNIDPNGRWTWKQVAIVGAVVAVAVAVTVVTAGAAAPAVAAAATAVGGTALGATGAAAVTVAGTVAVGTASGALSAGAADLTAQALTNEPDQSIDWNRAGAAAAGGGASGGALSIIPGVAAARAVGQAARTGATAAQAVSAARTATAATGSIGSQLARGVGTGVVSGAAGGAIDETTRQVASGESTELGGLDFVRIATATGSGAAFGAGGAAVGTTLRAARRNVNVRRAARQATNEGTGPVAAAVHEPASNQVFIGTNRPPERRLHDLLDERLREFGDIPSESTHPNYFGRPGQQHAEINALNEALHARQSALGRELTEADLGDLLLHAERRSSAKATHTCPRCSFVTSGVGRTSQLQAAERRWFNRYMSGDFDPTSPLP